MSVIGFSREEMGKLAHALISGEERQRSNGSLFFIHQDDMEMAYDEKAIKRWKKEPEPFDEDAWRRNKIAVFVDHLWIANQVAYHVQYPSDGMNGLERLEEEDIKNGALMTGHILHQQLTSVRYNLYTNGGSVFLGPPDMEKLDHLINRMADKLARSNR
jgi:hypothetical protein